MSPRQERTAGACWAFSLRRECSVATAGRCHLGAPWWRIVQLTLVIGLLATQRLKLLLERSDLRGAPQHPCRGVALGALSDLGRFLSRSSASMRRREQLVHPFTSSRAHWRNAAAAVAVPSAPGEGRPTGTAIL